MSNKHKPISKEELILLANEYCDNCIDGQKEKATGSGRVVKVKSRHLPTVGYFIHHWLRRSKFDFYTRTYWYDVMNNASHPLSDTVQEIQTSFDALAIDIIANEGKGVFYAKNKLGMSDNTEQKTQDSVIRILNIDPLQMNDNS
jgi:hypothetical protein